MRLLLMGVATYVGIIACVWMVSSVYRDGGTFGVIGLFALIIFGLWIGSNTNDNGKNKKDQ